MQTLIEITQDLIDRGDAGKCLTCPIAKAVNHVLNEHCNASVTKTSIYINHNVLHPHEIKLSEPAQDFVWAFDSGEPVKPFSFWLDIPKVYLLDGEKTHAL